LSITLPGAIVLSDKITILNIDFQSVTHDIERETERGRLQGERGRD
jgi:hypothetical protein